MFNPTTIKTNYAGLIGFRNSRDPDLQNLTSALTSSVSGIYFEDAHPFINIDNLDALAPAFASYNYSAYSASTTNLKGEKVIYVNRLWTCLTDCKGVTPGSSDTTWKLELCNWIDEQVGTSAIKVIDAVLTGKKLTGQQKGLFESLHLFDGRVRLSDTITKYNRRIGFEIRLKRAENVKAVIEKIGVMFNSVQSGLTIDLHHPGIYSPVATYPITANTANTFSWVDCRKDLPFADHINNYDSGGIWYLSYLESSVTGSAINKRYDFSAGACVGCGGYNSSAYNLWNKYFEIYPFEVQSADVNGANLWDVDTMGYTRDTNYGLNLSISVQPDFTDLLISQKKLFARAVALQFAIDTLTMLRYNSNARSNAHINIPRNEEIIYDLDGERGLKRELNDQIKGLQQDFSELGDALPKARKGIKWGSI